MALVSGLITKLIAGTAPTADGGDILQRLGPYGEQFTIPMLAGGDGEAISGSSYQALQTPAVGPAGVAMGIQTTFSDTANVAFCLVNGASAGGKRVIMEYIKLRITAAGSSSTSAEAAIEIDSTNRYSSGGTALTPVSTTTEDNTASIVTTCRFSAITAAGAGANRKWIWHDLIRKAAAPLWIINDTVLFRFGDFEGLGYNANLVSSTDAGGSKLQFPVPPAVIGPGGSILLHIANIANASTAPSIQVSAGWKEF